MVTPFLNDQVDEGQLRRFVDWQIQEGISGLVPCGTTGESPVLDEKEQEKVIAITVETVNRRIPVVAGAGTNDTRKTIKFAHTAKKTGADAILVIVPYYNKPNPEGQFLHFKKINDEVDLPIIIYNNPARSVVDMPVEIMARLAELPNIIGVKDATGDLARPVLLKTALNKEFAQLSGDDATSLPFLAAGGQGCISVTANIAPRLCSEMQNAFTQGQMTHAQMINKRLIKLHKLMFLENSPGPVKYGTHLLGFGLPDTRLPLAPITDGMKGAIQSAMREAGLLK